MKPEMTHGEVESLLPWYANGALEGAELRAVAEHLEQCEACREELKFLGDVRAVLRVSAAAEQPAPIMRNAGFASLPSDLQARVLAAPRRQFRKRYWVPALAASFLAAVGLGVAMTVAYLDAPRFQTATHGSVASSDRHALVAVRFVPQTALAELNDMLRRYDAVVVRGPDDSEQWLLEIPLGEDRDVASMLPLLNKSAGIQSVELMEDANNPE